MSQPFSHATGTVKKKMLSLPGSDFGEKNKTISSMTGTMDTGLASMLNNASRSISRLFWRK